jgi:hypothetical protein
LFVLTSVMSRARPGQVVCDVGLKVMSLDSGLPVVHGRGDVRYVSASDEHGVIGDQRGALQPPRLVRGRAQWQGRGGLAGIGSREVARRSLRAGNG